LTSDTLFVNTGWADCWNFRSLGVSMRIHKICPIASLFWLASVMTQPLVSQTPPSGGQGGAPAAAGPTAVLAPGLNPVPDYRGLTVPPPPQKIPDGFTSLFNGVDLTGWHISRTARHGLTPDFHVAQGMILGTQSPLGGGGLLLTDKKYKNFEFYMEAKPDWGDDSGVFFRCTEEGAAYQITMDFLPGGTMGRLIQEGGITLKLAGAPPLGAARGGAAGASGAPVRAPDPGMTIWKHEDWNTVRIRVEGDFPHVTVWINGQQVSDASDTQNSAAGGMIEGPIALQIHGGPVRWQPGGFWRWRNIAIRELP
jgi:hypothetical protein